MTKASVTHNGLQLQAVHAGIYRALWEFRLPRDTMIKTLVMRWKLQLQDESLQTRKVYLWLNGLCNQATIAAMCPLLKEFI